MANLQLLSCLYQFKSNNSCINDASLIKLHVHHNLIMIYIQLKFHEIVFIVHLVSALFVNFTLIQGQ